MFFFFAICSTLEGTRLNVRDYLISVHSRMFPGWTFSACNCVINMLTFMISVPVLLYQT